MPHKLSQFRPEWELHNPDISSVIATAHIIKQTLTAMWGNDVEFNQIDEIVENVRNWALSCVEAILKIEAIPESKHGNGGHGLQW